MANLYGLFLMLSSLALAFGGSVSDLSKRSGQLKEKRDDDIYVTHDELDEAVSGLTSMMDLLSTQILQLDMRVTEQDTAIAEVQQNRVKRCETGRMEMECRDSCCYIDGSTACTSRPGSVATYDIVFQQAFTTVPMVALSGVNNYWVREEPVSDPYYRGFWYRLQDSWINTNGFTFELQAGNLDYPYYECWYTFSWIACELN